MNKRLFFIFNVVLICSFFIACSSKNRDWRTADRSSANIAPLPQEEPQAIVQVYAARAFSWRGYFGVHSWIATKEAGATEYTTYHVLGWRIRQNQSSVVVESGGIPDAKWYGNFPELICDLRGEKAESAIGKIKQASENYPYQNTYRIWPGPNSNTYISHLIRNTPEIGIELPPTAIGKDWLSGWPFAVSETGTGAQVNLFGVLGLTVGLSDGLEVNVLGLNFGVDVLRPALKLPFVGRLGFRDASL